MDGLSIPQQKLPLEDHLRREVRFEEGFDHRHDPDPEKQKYGCHGMNIRFLLHGIDGSVQFLIYTGWLPSWAEVGIDGERSVGPGIKPHFPPMAADLGYHWDYPTHEDQMRSSECEFRSNPCYYEGSGLAADSMFADLLTGGGEKLWENLSRYYRRIQEMSREP